MFSGGLVILKTSFWPYNENLGTYVLLSFSRMNDLCSDDGCSEFDSFLKTKNAKQIVKEKYSGCPRDNVPTLGASNDPALPPLKGFSTLMEIYLNLSTGLYAVCRFGLTPTMYPIRVPIHMKI